MGIVLSKFCFCGGNDKYYEAQQNESTETVDSFDDGDIFYDSAEVWVASRYGE